MSDTMNPLGIKERSIPLAILFCIITFGIYNLFWIYKLHDDANAVTLRKKEMHPALVVLLCVVTFGIFQIYWAYTQGEKFKEEARRRGSGEADECPILYLVLQIASYFIGITSIVNLALMQDRINQFLRKNGWGKKPYEEFRYSYVAERDIARRYEQAEAEYNEQSDPSARTDIYR